MENDMNLPDVGVGSDGRLEKMEEDYGPKVDVAVPAAENLTKAGKLMEALESLYPLEKQTRLGADMKSNTRLTQAMVRLCFEAGNWNALNDTIVNLSKKRSIIKHAIAKMVRDAVEMVDKTPNDEIKQKLINTLRTVTEGKIYVEVERARLTYRVVKRLEGERKLEEAATMMLDLQVETYGSMDVKEKVEYLLEQMRLCIERKDYVRSSIISRKISTKFFKKTDDDEVQILKERYYQLMIKLGLNDHAYLDVCRHYHELYNTPAVKEKNEHLEALKSAVLYVLLAPHVNEQWDLLHRIKQLRDMELIAEYRALMDLFTTEELISWQSQIVGLFENHLRPPVDKAAKKPDSSSLQATKSGRVQLESCTPATEVFNRATDLGNKHWDELQNRVGEHNIRMIAKYYTQIDFARMNELLAFKEEKMEEFLCKMIVDGVVTAKIDRSSRVVDFRPRKQPIAQLDEWSSSVHRLTDILNKVSHQIAKEQMVHRHLHVHGKT